MYNRSVLVGRFTADPELRQTPNGVSVTSFTLAVDRRYTPKDGEKTVDFIDIVAWRQTAELICRFFSKGRAILVEGSIQVRSYVDKNGQNRRAWEVVADNFSFVESKNAGAPSSSGSAFAPEAMPMQEPPAAYSSGSVDDFAEIEDDGDLPF